MIAMRGHERWEEQNAQWYSYYLGRYRSEPAGGAYVSLWERVPTIYGVVTAPPYRRQGIAAHVMVRLVAETLIRGFPWTCLYVAKGNPARGLYDSLGYTYLLELTTYQRPDSQL
jgi:ribosomal protein S18 acetylase RimI-like enzyme